MISAPARSPSEAAPAGHEDLGPSWRERIEPALYAVFSLSVLWCAWEGAAQLNLAFVRILPPPSQFLRSLVASDFRVGLGSQSATVFGSIAASIWRVLAGLAIGFICALVFGALMSSSRIARLLVTPVIRLLAPIAPVAWIPLGLVVFGIGNQTAIFIVFMGVFFSLIIATMQAVENLPSEVINNARCLGCNRVQMWAWVVFPGILPSVFTTLRLNFIAAWMAVLAAEMTGLQDGLGAIVTIGRNLFDHNLILLGMFLIGLVGFAGDVLLHTIQRRFFWWGDKW
jgi:NitT/TauT family transport system permease protein